MRLPRLLLLPLLFTASCGGGGESGSFPLPLGEASGEGEFSISEWEFAAKREVEVTDLGDSIVLEAALPAQGWSAMGSAGLWSAPRPFASALHRSERVTGGLRHPELDLRLFDGALSALQLDALDPGTYVVTSHAVFVQLEADASPPDGMRFGVELERGLHRGEEWRPVVGGVTGEGLAVWTGEERSVTVAIPPHSALQLYAAVELLGSATEEAPLVLALAIEGKEYWRWEAAPIEGLAGAAHRIALPSEGLEEAELTFTTTGPPARVAIFAPRIVPREAEVARDGPPDLILFLADTFRADNLAAYGGLPDTTPFLDALATRSRFFHRAWAPAAWTLPSQASMFTGLQPVQHGARSTFDVVSGELLTLAEGLRAHGYRTVAVTDSGYVSRNFGFDQGFELFVERRDWNLVETLRVVEELRALEDDRPLFLFIQTFRTHVPYRVGVEENVRVAQLLLRDFSRRVAALGGDGSLSLEEAGARYHELYRRGARGLDAAFAPWFTGLEKSGYFRRGHFLFTSDHGEEFTEHGAHGHGGEHWEERVRIPLFLYGPEIEPRIVDHAATLRDLPRTFAALAGIEPDRAWGGTDLLRLDADRPVRTYSLLPTGENLLTILDGTHKVHLDLDLEHPAGSTLRHVFDLAVDPREQEDLLRQSPTWAERLWRHAESEVAREVIPVVETERTVIDEETRRYLREIGYGGW